MTALIETPTIANYRRVLNAMDCDLFNDFNYISVHNTNDAERRDDGTIIIKGDRYDDELVVIHRDEYGDGLAIFVARGTTQPGAGVREQPYDGTEGAGTIAPGFYQAQLEYGKWGEFDALRQRQGKHYWVYRDPNHDQDLDLAIATIGKGYGFETHRRRGSRVEVKRSYGGCQGTLHEKDFERLLELFRIYNTGPICSHFVLFSHWLYSPTEQVRSEWLRIKAHIEGLV